MEEVELDDDIEEPELDDDIEEPMAGADDDIEEEEVCMRWLTCIHLGGSIRLSD